MALSEWLGMILRWAHVVAAIFWIGHAFMFNMLDSSLEPPEDDDPRKGVEGDLWMVHGGGFYTLSKGHVFPTDMRGPLHWFKWEAAFTFLTGFALLVVVFYLGGGVFLTDPSVADIGHLTGVGIGLGTLVITWVVYDLIWVSPLGKNSWIGGALTTAMIVGVAFGLSQLLSGRAAYIHVGAMIGTWMTANVWMRIIPAMKKMVAKAKETGEPLDPSLGKAAKQRSRHNNYLVFPLIFIMVSNHYPSLYGHAYNWLVLVLIMVGLAALKHLMNLNFKLDLSGYVAAGVLLASLVGFGGLMVDMGGDVGGEPLPAPSADGRAIDAETAGAIRGVVMFEGEPPERTEIRMLAGCETQVSEPVFDDAVLVTDGKLANVFVRVTEGLEGWQIPPAPDAAVELDQRACVYAPHVVGVRVGQPVAFLNSDPLFHNVRSVTQENGTFNEMMQNRDTRIDKVFRRPEIMVTAKCDVHPWMAAYIGVVDHPFFAVTNGEGAFELKGLPPGPYTVSAWHEVYGEALAEVQVPSSGEAEASFTFRP